MNQMNKRRFGAMVSLLSISLFASVLGATTTTSALHVVAQFSSVTFYSTAAVADNDIWAADLHLTPNGRFLYASERTSGTLALFNVDAGTGQLTYVGSTPTEKQPRGFAIDSSGRYLVASGEKSNTISIYSIDQASGALRPLQQYPGGKGGNWVEIVSFD